ncbi:hypothetical protein DE146DRAFT_357962 [Phaeosphaeria sp. MPI-PUGE-AT-0046c]|nr:hypothetical protein DE146DRAFT_357962 [Phaeosphaeria sp. MPI-PUGE-AT-0046c]
MCFSSPTLLSILLLSILSALYFSLYTSRSIPLALYFSPYNYRFILLLNYFSSPTSPLYTPTLYTSSSTRTRQNKSSRSNSTWARFPSRLQGRMESCQSTALPTRPATCGGYTWGYKKWPNLDALARRPVPRRSAPPPRAAAHSAARISPRSRPL